jgi:hypothetical protein
MSNPLDPVRIAFEKAVGPHRKRLNLMSQLKEPDVTKTRRAELVKESEALEAEWLTDMIALWKAMDQCAAFQAKVKA